MPDNREPEEQRDILRTVCPFSMAGGNPIFCRADCQAFKGGYDRHRDLCVIIESLNGMSMNLRMLLKYVTGGSKR